LKQADFKVFEDGVEQKIAAFSSERTDVSTPANPAAEPSQSIAVAPAPPKPSPKRHAYVICLDLMHASFGNFVHVREALQKLFREEQPGDSQYAVIALGRSIQIIQNTTSDPAKVLESLSGAEFKKIYRQSQAIASQTEISQFESKVQEVRAACDVGNIECNLKPTLPTEANQLSEHERSWTTKFAAELRSVVEQLAAGNGRRMLVLISDGFSLAPGGTSFWLLQAYFPEFRSTRTVERIQDLMEPIYKLAVKGNVPIYTIDSRGLYTAPGYDVSRGVLTPQVDSALNTLAIEAGQTLVEIAEATGGTAYQNSNDLFTGMKKAFSDGREYYSLAYVSTNQVQDGSFRKIDVRVRDTKATVSAKRGYWAPTQ
jgi:VWFA-related protein